MIDLTALLLNWVICKCAGKTQLWSLDKDDDNEMRQEIYTTKSTTEF